MKKPAHIHVQRRPGAWHSAQGAATGPIVCISEQTTTACHLGRHSQGCEISTTSGLVLKSQTTWSEDGGRGSDNLGMSQTTWGWGESDNLVGGSDNFGGGQTTWGSQTT